MIKKLIIAACFFFLFAAQASGQYFGRNKIRCKSFDFSVVHTAHFDVYYYSKENKAILATMEMLERWHDRFVKIFKFSLHHQIVIVYRNHSDFRQTNILSDYIDQGTGGIEEELGQRILLAVTGVRSEDDHAAGHEVAHAFQFELIRKYNTFLALPVSAPSWFLEGMAEYLSMDDHDPVTAMWLREAVQNRKLPSFSEIAHYENRFNPYRFGQAIWAYIAGIWGDSIVAPLMISVLQHGWQKGFSATLGFSADSVSDLWQTRIYRTFAPQDKGRADAAQSGRLVLGEVGNCLSPAVSPGGNAIAFLSAQDASATDLRVLTLGSPRTERTLGSLVHDPHYDAINFLRSPGAWSPDGGRFAAILYDKCNSAIKIFETGTWKILRTIFVGADEIWQLAWSPDGRSIVFFTVENGTGRLCRYDLPNGNGPVILVQGPFAFLQPACSPDGKTIAFATVSGLPTPRDGAPCGRSRIGLLDLETGKISIVAISGAARHTDPQFSVDGNSLYFIADPGGIGNIYRYEFSTRNFFRITNAAAGVSGPTAFSPALSVSARSNAVVFTMLNNGKFNCYRLPDSALSGEPYIPPPDSAYESNTLLGPALQTEMSQAAPCSLGVGLPRTPFSSATAYKPSLSLTYFGQIFIGAAGNQFGLNASEGSVIFSDVLSNHLVGIGGELNSVNLYDLGVQAGYLNQTGQWNWGGSMSHIPYEPVMASFGNDSSVSAGQTIPVRTAEFIRQRTVIDEVNAVLQKPITENTRWEFNLTYSVQTFRNNLFLYASPSGGPLVNGTAGLTPAVPPPLQQLSATAALIGDYSLDGFTAPRSGSRYHLEIGPALGSLNYAFVQADYRYYLYMKPFTLAFRALHVGQWGDDPKTGQFPILFLGFPTWVRGYTGRSFDFSKWNGDTTAKGDWALFNRLSGTKVGIGNFELRLPVLGSPRLGLFDFRYLPTDFLMFLDGGLAWTGNKDVALKFATRADERVPVFGTGCGLRFNILGVLAFQVYFVYPIQRPDKGAFFDYEFSTGW